jgi:hypothetical protein
MMDGFDPVVSESLWLKNVKELKVDHLEIRGEDVLVPSLFGEIHADMKNVTLNGQTI